MYSRLEVIVNAGRRRHGGGVQGRAGPARAR